MALPALKGADTLIFIDEAVHGRLHAWLVAHERQGDTAPNIHDALLRIAMHFYE